MAFCQLSVFLENKVGALSEIIGILSENNINLKAINIAETSDYGIVRIIADDTRKAAAVLSAMDYVVSASEICIAKVPDKVGGLNGVLKIFSDNGIQIEYMYSVFGLADGMAMMCFRVDDTEKAGRILTGNGFGVADKSELGVKN